MYLVDDSWLYRSNHLWCASSWLRLKNLHVGCELEVGDVHGVQGHPLGEPTHIPQVRDFVRQEVLPLSCMGHSLGMVSMFTSHRQIRVEPRSGVQVEGKELTLSANEKQID